MNEALERRLVAYADGELDAAEAAKVEAEMSRSREARRVVDGYTESLRMVREGLSEPPTAPSPLPSATAMRASSFSSFLRSPSPRSPAYSSLMRAMSRSACSSAPRCAKISTQRSGPARSWPGSISAALRYARAARSHSPSLT